MSDQCEPGLVSVIVPTYNRARLVSRMYSREAIVAPPGVDDAFFRWDKRDSTHLLRLLTVSRLHRGNRRKNVDGVVRALSLLPKGLPVRYDVVGDGDDRQRLERIASRLGLGRQVNFRGRVSRDALLESYRDADLFVLAAKASRFDIEGFGMVFIEASAAGTPAICSKKGGATDAVKDGVNGILIDSSSPKAIANGILRFVEMRGDFPQEKVKAYAEAFRWRNVVEPIRREIHRASVAT